MATLCGARALGMEDKIGSIEVGKQADLIAVDLSASNTQPVYNAISQLVYAANSRQVSHSWINGKPILRDGELCQMDTTDIHHKAQLWAQKIIRERNQS